MYKISFINIQLGIKDSTKRSVWSRTTLITEVDPPSCKMGTFFLRPLTLTEPSLNNFQLNGAKMF